MRLARIVALGVALIVAGLPGGVVRAATPAPGPQPVPSGTALTATAGEAGYNAFPEGLALPDGTIRAYYTHGDEHGGPAVGQVRSSTDGGAHWTPPAAVGTIRSPIRLASGVIVAASIGTTTGTGKDARRPASTRSRDGLSWTSDGLAADGAGFGGEAVPFSLVQLNDGSLLMSVSGKATTTATTWFVRYLRSTDDGRTWTVRSTIQVAGRSLMEPTLAVNRAGLVVTAMRVDNATATDGTIHMAQSSDGGATWSSLRPVFEHASGLPRLAFLQDGALVAMYRSTWTDFAPLRYARSVDSGTTWSYGLDFTGGSLRKMMGGAWIVGPDRSSLAVLYGLEADWYHASVHFRRLAIPSSGVEVRGMSRRYVHAGKGTFVELAGRVVGVASDGVERVRSGAGLHFSLRSFDPRDGTLVASDVFGATAGTDGRFKVLVPLPRHGELTLTVDGMTGAYRVGTYRAKPGFLTCPASQTATAGATYWLWCQARPAAGMGGEFLRWDGVAWVHQKSAWADASGTFRTPITVSADTRYQLTIWQTKWTDRVTSRVITVDAG